MHSQQQQQQQPPPPPQSLMQSQHHNHHHHHQHQQHQQSTLPPQQQPSQQQQSQQHLHGNIAEQPHYHAQSHNHSHIDHSRGQHHINQSQQTHLQHRQQHQPHPQQQQQQHLHQQTHHQQSHHHHPHHQMQPTQPHHHMAHHGMAPMIPYGQNIMYTPHSMGPAFSTTGHIAPHAFNPAPLANHRSDPINVSSQPQPQNQPQAQPSAHTQPPAQPQTQAQQQPPIEQQPQQTIPQQPQPPPGNINPNNIAHMSQLPPPVINTSNPGVHPLSNGPMMDSHMQNRMTFSHMPQHFVQHPYGMHHPPQMMQFPMHQNYLGGLMPPPNAPMMTAKVPIDMVRPPYDLQNHAGPITAKVPSSQATPIIAKPPGAVPLVAGSQPQPAPTTTLVKQRRPRLAIVDPKTRHVFTDDELRGSPTGSTTPATDVSTSTTTTATSTSTTNANPVSVKPSQASVPKENEAVVSTQLAPEAKPVATNSSQSATVITKKPIEQARLEDHVHHSPQHASTPSPLTAKASTLDDTQQVVTKEQSRTPNAITTSASTLADSMQALSVTPLEHSKEPSIKTNVQENLDDAKVIQTDVVDKAIPREEGDTILGDKEDNHETADQVEPPAKKLNPDFPYEAGQYSPLNPAGHRRYTMEFLKAVGRSMQLEDREADNDFFRPNFVQNTIHNDYSIPRRSSQQALNNKQPVRRIIATQSLQPEVAFKTSENPWKPELEKEKTKAVETGEIDTQRLLKVFRGLLNKITPQKYDSIIEKIEMLNLEGDDRLKSVIDLVFDKAVDEPGFCELYARMSKVIAARNSQFNHHLLKKCQDEFETNDLYIGLNIETREVEIENETDPNKKKFLSDELYEDMRLRRKKYLGTIKLIGEMYKLDLLVPKIIGFCISRLLTEVSNENLECLCSLIVTVGPKMLSENDEKIRASIKNTLQILSEIANSKKTNELFTLESRIKFKILDTIDLSRKNWKPRMVENNPKKLSEIHEETKQRPQNFSRSSMKNNDSAVPPRRNIQNQSFMRR